MRPFACRNGTTGQSHVTRPGKRLVRHQRQPHRCSGHVLEREFAVSGQMIEPHVHRRGLFRIGRCLRIEHLGALVHGTRQGFLHGRDRDPQRLPALAGHFQGRCRRDNEESIGRRGFLRDIAEFSHGAELVDRNANLLRPIIVERDAHGFVSGPIGRIGLSVRFPENGTGQCVRTGHEADGRSAFLHFRFFLHPASRRDGQEGKHHQ